MPPLWFDVMSAERLEERPGESRRQRIVRWVLEYRDHMGRDFDHPDVKGRAIIDIGRRPGSGELEAKGVFHGASEDL